MRRSTTPNAKVLIERAIFTILKSGQYLSQDSIKILFFWTRTLFKSGLYSKQASIREFTVYGLRY